MADGDFFPLNKPDGRCFENTPCTECVQRGCCKKCIIIPGPAGPSGPPGPPGPAGSLPRLERGMFWSEIQQTITPDGIQPVIFDRSFYVTSGITYEDGVLSLNVPGLYYISYELYPATGASPATKFRISDAGIAEIFLTLSPTLYAVDNTLVSASFLYAPFVPDRLSLTLMGPNPVIFPRSSPTLLRARFLIQQITTGTENVTAIPNQKTFYQP